MFGLSAAATSALSFKYTMEEVNNLEAHMRETLSSEDFEQWEQRRTEERRHQELCKAIRDSKPDPVDNSPSLAKIIFGACLAGSIARD